ncbi:MAG: hypothetical protein EA359_18595 [Balneolaceae bacterium]|nr:MAG: hypothetical protein EA359_18595 [Balneolaceae bacterium]
MCDSRCVFCDVRYVCQQLASSIRYPAFRSRNADRSVGAVRLIQHPVSGTCANQPGTSYLNRHENWFFVL